MAMSGVIVGPARELRGVLRVPGDKSITHRALFLAALNTLTTRIHNQSPADDCARTLELVRALGRDVDVHGATITVAQRREPAGTGREAVRVDCGNSGTTARLAMGLLAAEPGAFELVGDESLSRRPMERVAEPLRSLGAVISTTTGSLPARIVGRADLPGSGNAPIAVASAQVHAALALAGLRSRSGVALRMTRAMRDHTLRMLRLFGIDVDVRRDADGEIHRITPATVAREVSVEVPGDFSSAAFIVTAAILVPGSEITVEDVGLNRSRIAYLRALEAMGADLSIDVDESAFEPTGRITARYSPALRAVDFSAQHAIAAAEMIDELPLLALVATRARGTTCIGDATELRVKESDRIASTAAVLRSVGANVVERPDGFVIAGDQSLRAAGPIDPCGDHRLAMMGAIAAMLAPGGATITDADVARVSYPRYWHDLERLGAAVAQI